MYLQILALVATVIPLVYGLQCNVIQVPGQNYLCIFTV